MDERFRAKGIGTKLIALTKQKAKKAGFKALSLMVLADNTDAQRLYARCGFETAEAVKRHKKSHQFVVTDLVFLVLK
jgi:ribosomal protein S18 acetylase RimI-like enzyme